MPRLVSADTSPAADQFLGLVLGAAVARPQLVIGLDDFGWDQVLEQVPDAVADGCFRYHQSAPQSGRGPQQTRTGHRPAAARARIRDHRGYGWRRRW